MQFGFLGIDYKNADLTIRDEISFTDQKKLEFFHKAEEIGVEQVMILSTCNRSEIYYFFDDEQQIKKIQNIYCDIFCNSQIPIYPTDTGFSLILNVVFTFFAQVIASLTTLFSSFLLNPMVLEKSKASFTCPRI